MGRAPCCDKANVKRGPWSPEEDSKLKSYIETHGTGGNWIALPQKIGLKRCGKSCRLRWLNYLRPNIKHGGFTEDEDNLICSLYISIGSRWSIIAAQLPGRTDNDIKNYWNTRLKKKLFGRQRTREQSKKLDRTKKIGYGSIDECFSVVYPQLPQVAAEPLLPPPPPYSGLETATCDQEPNTLTSIPTVHPNYPQLPNKFGNFSYTSDHNYHLSKTFNYNDFHGFLHLPAGNDFRPIDDVGEDIRIPHCLNNYEPNNLSGSDMYFLSSAGPGEAWGDANCLICPSPERKTPQEWTYYDEPRLLEY